jgi:hypothetical protein
MQNTTGVTLILSDYQQLLGEGGYLGVGRDTWTFRGL